ncbi:GntR family transcriptional regulator [Ahrensia kielensis]|uniref:GntR family transcriptional regulator n=1 Tax=Ahrensia kielensis TaxID=76980 RepID=UPI000373E7B7|nr:GntR family transcriptional regulator [Ahrensia kielensis]
MNIQQTLSDTRRQTSAEEIFQKLKDDIVSLRLQPGAKLSEVEIAKQYEVSRQPVREAFLRLGDLNLLQIRPQKATLVRKISLQDLRNTRFIRTAVEVEVVRIACKKADKDSLALLRDNLEKQALAIEGKDSIQLHSLDYQFHRLICFAADRVQAFEVIAANKAHTDRVCTLELADTFGMAEVLEDHSDIVNAIEAKDEDLAVACTRHHLAHLDGTLFKACENHADFFED